MTEQANFRAVDDPKLVRALVDVFAQPIGPDWSRWLANAPTNRCHTQEFKEDISRRSRAAWHRRHLRLLGTHK